jgi:hypothetical protein
MVLLFLTCVIRGYELLNTLKSVDTTSSSNTERYDGLGKNLESRYVLMSHSLIIVCMPTARKSRIVAPYSVRHGYCHITLHTVHISPSSLEHSTSLLRRVGADRSLGELAEDIGDVIDRRSEHAHGT